MREDPKLILITLLVELGVAAAFSSSLARSTAFKNLLLAPHRTFAQSLKLVAMICGPLVLGVWIRVSVPNFLAADISYEATILMGVLLGPAAAMVGGAVLALPAVLHREYMALPVNLLVALIFGMAGKLANMEDVWSFSADDRPEHLPLGDAEPAAAAPGPADPVPGADHGGAVCDQHAGTGVPAPVLRAELLRLVCRAGDLPGGAGGGGNPAEDLERHSD